MTDFNPAAPDPFDSSAAAHTLYGDAPAEDAKPVVEQPEHPGDKLWGKDGADPDAAPKPPTQQPTQPEAHPQQDAPQPAGDDYHVPQDLRTEFDSHTTELGIDKANAEKLFTKMQPVIQKQQQEVIEDRIDRWSDETREHYGDGLDDALRYAGQALHAHEGGKELEAFLDKSGLSANKTVLRFLNSVAKRQRR